MSALLCSLACSSIVYAHKPMTLTIVNNTDHRLKQNMVNEPTTETNFITPHSTKEIVIPFNKSSRTYIKTFEIVASEKLGGRDYCFVVVNFRDRNIWVKDVFKDSTKMKHTFTCEGNNNEINVYARQ